MDNLPPKVLKIARMGHPILSQVAQEVIDPTADSVHFIIQEMIATATDFGRYSGLAAPQVHIPYRIVIIHVDKDKCEASSDPEGIFLTPLINPRIEILTDKTQMGWEGCMSVPGMMGRVSRATHIGLHYYTPYGEFIEREIKGYPARVIQHEVDHLDGILYPQRMHDFSKFGFMDEVIRYSLKSKESRGAAPLID